MLASEIQGKKNKRSLSLLVILTIATLLAFFLVRSGDRASVDKEIFRSVDFEAVNKIRIENARDTVDLAFENSRWLVNGEHPADRSLVTLFFATLKQAEPKREISDVLADSIGSNTSNKVTLFSDGQVVQQFTASGNESKTQSFFKDPKSGKLFLMTIPGYRVYVSGIFELTTGGWRDKLLFGSFNWRNFQSLEARFSEKPAENFRVEAEGPGILGVAGIKADTAKLNKFLYDVSMVAVQDYPESSELKDSLTQVKPFLTLIITDIAKKQHTLNVYRENENGVLGLWMGDEAVLFDPQAIRNIIRPKSFFVEK